MVGRKSEIKELNRFSGASDSGDDFDIWSPPIGKPFSNQVENIILKPANIREIDAFIRDIDGQLQNSGLPVREQIITGIRKSFILI